MYIVPTGVGGAFTSHSGIQGWSQPTALSHPTHPLSLLGVVFWLSTLCLSPPPSVPLTLSCSAGLLLDLQQAALLFGAWLPPRVLEAAFSRSALSKTVLSAELLHPLSRPPALQGSCSLGLVSLSGLLLALPWCWKGLYR